MAKLLKYDNDAKQKILAGVEKLEKAVSTTLGPAGKNVIIDEFGSIHSTKDGVTVAKAVVLKDPFENIGANAIKEVAMKSNDQVGDGTTTSTLLAATIYKNGLKYVSLGSNATQIKNGITKAAKYVVSKVESDACPINDKKDIKKVCTVAANGDEQIGEIISDVMDKIGKDGIIKVEDGQTTEMTSKIVEGMVIENGYVSPWMVTNQQTMESDLDNPFVLLVNKKLSNLQELLPSLQLVSQNGQGRPLVIIADEFADDITATLVMNTMRGSIRCVCVKSPSYGENRKAVLEDIAILTGGKVIADDNGNKLEQASFENGVIGSAKRIVVNKDSSVIFGGYGDKNAIDERISSLRTQIEKSDSSFDKKKLEDRLGKLANGIGIISVGADTEAERKEKRDRVDDAFCAAKSAVKSGIVIGGGAELLKVKKHLADAISNNDVQLVGDESIGAKILCDSLEAPIRKILNNAGIDSSLIISKLYDNKDDKLGYDVIKKDFVDMFADGIIDSADVVINEVKNSASVASLLLTTEALIVEEPRSKADQNDQNNVMY